MTKVASTEAPKFGGRPTSFANYDEKVHLWKRVSTMDPEKGAAHLLLHTSDVPRKVCLSVGEDVVGNLDGVGQILKIWRGRFAPDAIDSIPQDVGGFLYFKRAEQDADAYMMGFEMLRRKW